MTWRRCILTFAGAIQTRSELPTFSNTGALLLQRWHICVDAVIKCERQHKTINLLPVFLSADCSSFVFVNELFSLGKRNLYVKNYEMKNNRTLNVLLFILFEARTDLQPTHQAGRFKKAGRETEHKITAQPTTTKKFVGMPFCQSFLFFFALYHYIFTCFFHRI